MTTLGGPELCGPQNPNMQAKTDQQGVPVPAPPNYPLRYPKYHLIETIKPLIEIHWGSRLIPYFNEDFV